MTYHLLVDRRTLAEFRHILPAGASIRFASDYADLVAHAGHDFGCIFIVTPELLPVESESLREVMHRTGAVLILATCLTPRATQAVIRLTDLRAQSLLLLPYDDPSQVFRADVPLIDHELPRLFLDGIASHLSQLPGRLGSGLLLALHSSLQLTSVKELAAWCRISPRSIERWCHRADLSPRRLLACTRFIRARSACDRQMSSSSVARHSGYSQPRALWRSVRTELRLRPATFRMADPSVLVIHILELLRSGHGRPNRSTQYCR